MNKLNKIMVAAMLAAVIALAAVARVHAVVHPGNGPAPLPTKCLHNPPPQSCNG